MLMYNFLILYTIPHKIREKTCFDILRKESIFYSRVIAKALNIKAFLSITGQK
jgi:hypothetical protein